MFSGLKSAIGPSLLANYRRSAWRYVTCRLTGFLHFAQLFLQESSETDVWGILEGKKIKSKKPADKKNPNL